MMPELFNYLIAKPDHMKNTNASHEKSIML